MTVVDKYRRFHGKGPKSLSAVNFSTPKHFIRLGRAVAIEYECDKLHGGGDGKKAVYRHVFDRGAVLVMDEKMRKVLYIIGGKIKVTKAGIEH
jgi:hypothetical protein